MLPANPAASWGQGFFRELTGTGWAAVEGAGGNPGEDAKKQLEGKEFAEQINTRGLLAGGGGRAKA